MLGSQVQVYMPETGGKALFRCARWLDRGEDDNETVRELAAVSGGLYPTPLPGICTPRVDTNLNISSLIQ